jgi:hypothetical protein
MIRSRAPGVNANPSELNFRARLSVDRSMKAFLISRPGDFGVLEDHWEDDPLLLPLPGGSVLDLHEASLKALGVTEARLLRCHVPGEHPDCESLEASLAGRALNWSVRSWPVAPWPQGWTLAQALDRQRFFLDGDEALIFSAPVADPRGWTGPKVPHGFPRNESRAWAPWVRTADGNLLPWDGPTVSFAGTRDFYQTSMRFLETIPPPALVLKGIHRQAVLEPPLSLGTKVRAASHSHLGPLVQLAAGSTLDHGTSLARTLVLTPTRFAKDQALIGKIVVGHTVVEPVRGETVPFPSV